MKNLNEISLLKILAILFITIIVYLFSVNVRVIREDIQFVKEQCISSNSK